MVSCAKKKIMKKNTINEKNARAKAVLATNARVRTGGEDRLWSSRK